jgi:putative oxidoreductase
MEDERGQTDWQEGATSIGLATAKRFCEEAARAFSLTSILAKGICIMESTRYLSFAGRLLIGLPFAMSGFGKLAAYGKTTAMIAAVGLPVPPLAYAAAVVIEIGGGLLLVAGYQVRLVAIALALFALATAFSFHGNFADQNQMIRFSNDRGAAAKAAPV